MSTSAEFIEFVLEQVRGMGFVRARKMFGEYMVYLNEKPLLLVCDNTVYVKMLPELAPLMTDAATGFPYEGAREHYLLDIEDTELCRTVLSILEPLTPFPVKKKKTGH